MKQAAGGNAAAKVQRYQPPKPRSDIAGGGVDTSGVKKPLRVLVTAFTPFEDPVNVSEVTVQKLDTSALSKAGVKIFIRTLAVGYESQDEALREAIAETMPDIVIGTGEINSGDYSIPSTRLDTRSQKIRSDTAKTVPQWMYTDTAFVSEIEDKMDATPVEVENFMQEGPCQRHFRRALEMMQKSGGQAFFIHFRDIHGVVPLVLPKLPEHSTPNTEEQRKIYERDAGKYAKQLETFIMGLLEQHLNPSIRRR